VFLQRNENTAMANIAAINSTEVQRKRNSMERLVRSFGANLQTTIYAINS